MISVMLVNDIPFMFNWFHGLQFSNLTVQLILNEVKDLMKKK